MQYAGNPFSCTGMHTAGVKCPCSQVHVFATLSCSPHHRMYYALGGMDNCCPNSNWLASVGSLHPGCDQADLGATG